MKLNSPKAQLIVFLTAFAFYLAITQKDIIFLSVTFIAVAAAVISESAVFFLKNKRLTLTDSSVITGLIIGYVISGGASKWVFILAALFAILSKYIIRSKGKHIFNPAGFGIFVVTFLCGAQTQWKGTYLWYILAPFGIYFIIRIRKLELLVSYFLTALVLFAMQAFVQKAPLPNIFGYFNYFFIFIMLIEPKTTPIKPWGKIIFGAGVAILTFIFTEIGATFETDLCALLIFNLLMGGRR